MAALRLIALLLVSCGGEPRSELGTSQQEEAPLPMAVPDAPLVVGIRELGPTGVVPSLVVVTASKEVFDASEIGGAPNSGDVGIESVDVRIEPEIPFSLSVVRSEAVEIRPEVAFAPDTTYTVTVSRFGEDAETPWTRTFSTPPMRLDRASLRSWEPRSGDLQAELVFSAAVDPAEVARRLHLSLDGRAIDARSVEQGTAPHRVVVSLHAPFAERLDVELAAGVPYLHDKQIRAPSAKDWIHVETAPSVQVHSAYLVEGAQGYYVEVVCNDEANGSGERYWYDRRVGNAWWVSNRCQLDEDAAESYVHTEPAAELSVAPGGGGFRIFGDFGRGSLRVSIDAGAPTVDGGRIQEAFERTLDVPARSPLVAFSQKGRYLPRDAWKNLAIRHRNTKSVTLEVRHVPPENLVFWMTGDEKTTDRTSNTVLSTTLPVNALADETGSAWLDMATLIPEVKRGIYELNIEGNGASDSARLLLTDMHLVAKAAAPGAGDRYTPRIDVWALDVHSGWPLDDVDVTLVKASGQRVARCTTDRDGGCSLTVPQDDVDTAPPVALLATREDDLTYIRFDDLELDLPDADTSGAKWTVAETWRASLWTDRGVYRPGDTAHVSALVRGEDFLAPEAGMPVVLTLHDPRGREVRRRVVETNAAGMISVDLPFGDYASTGRYRCALLVGDVQVGEGTFNIEEFVPERMAVEVTGSPSGHLASEAVSVDVSARWLFGGNADGARVETTCRLEPHTFSPVSGFVFGPLDLDGSRRSMDLGRLEGRLDDEGHLQVECPAPEGRVGPSMVVAQAAVFEGESGRTTVGTARVPVHPERFSIGLSSSADKVKAGQVFKVEGRVVDWEGRPAGDVDEVKVDIYRMEEEYTWWWDEWEDRSTQERSLRPAREETRTVAVKDGSFRLDVTPTTDSAGVMVRARAGEALTELLVDGSGRRYYWAAGAGTVDATPRPLEPTALPLQVPGETRVDEWVNVSVEAPYSGRILWTVETDHVVRSEWVDAVAGPNEWRFSIDDFVPNAYVSAFLVKDPHAESDRAYLPDRAFGVQSIRVEPEAYTFDVDLEVPAEVQPYSPLEVSLSVPPGSGPVYATIAAVDEGILSLTGFESPDPTEDVFARRALGVTSYETVGWNLLVEPAGPSSSTGGDASGGGGRVQMVKPVALWSGLVEVPQSGKAKVSFDVPGYRGELRVMAVAASGQRMGSDAESVTVRDPLVLQTTLPRFLVTGDEAQIPVFVSNQTGKDQDVTVRLEVEELQLGAETDVREGRVPPPPLAFLGEPEGKLAIAAGESATAVFRVKTRGLPGAAHLRVVATGGGHRSHEELDVPILVPSSETREVARMMLSPGDNAVGGLLEDWIEGSDKTTLWVTTNPYAHALTHLRYLVRYPYG